MTLSPVIIAGGSGTRLWPLSREQHPKQFLPLMGRLTMLQETLRRLDGIDDVADPTLVCNEAHRFLVAGQMREVGIRPSAIIVEPEGRNTAPALTLAALRLIETAQSHDRDPLMLVMPADHLVQDLKTFHSAVQVGASIADGGQLVTFGVVPGAPETGYGYIRKGQEFNVHSIGESPSVASSPSQGPTDRTTTQAAAYSVSAFVEKPDLETARSYVDSGNYLWNSGIFMMRASVWLTELERYRPDIARACRSAQTGGRVDGDFYRPSAADFKECPSDSIDYAVMEKAAGQHQEGTGKPSPADGPPSACAVVPLDAGWSDIGSWSSLWENGGQDSVGNVIRGDVYTHSTENSLLIGHRRLLATVGLEDVVVVETADAVLVARKDRVQDVREVVQRLKADGRPEAELHRKVNRPWGAYEIVDEGEGFQVKRLTVDPGAALSLQVHHQRAEHWVVVGGKAKVTRGDEEFVLNENESTYVPKGMTHRLANPGDEPLEIIEVETGTYLGEDDIVRFQDDYNRHSTC